MDAQYLKFTQDLALQFPIEKQLYELLTERNGSDDNESPAQEMTSDFNRYYDFKVQGLTYEIKNHLSSIRTGNVGIEWMCRGKLSGIYTSKADYHIHIVNGTDALVINTWDEKRYLQSLIDKGTIVVKDAGDYWKGGKASKIFLIKASEYRQLAEYVLQI